MYILLSAISLLFIFSPLIIYLISIVSHSIEDEVFLFSFIIAAFVLIIYVFIPASMNPKCHTEFWPLKESVYIEGVQKTIYIFKNGDVKSVEKAKPIEDIYLKKTHIYSLVGVHAETRTEIVSEKEVYKLKDLINE